MRSVMHRLPDVLLVFVRRSPSARRETPFYAQDTISSLGRYGTDKRHQHAVSIVFYREFQCCWCSR